ncbi:ATP-binding cassette domain-containing protein [Haloferax sp. MBLA0076]|uniref:ATP-binding cassette domain-containing protein n=1 Tax=Haloferax litoreum TaxID=2666140 RepID=A0A6A8GLT4_9EURY|nr:MULTISPECIES: ABC transporter ATP-binding protein [Haloferax]KAB1190056.1 ABC transporter ATP-binding protein [Haloferax sp. CBA1148]MRX23831.1 ATP-binding cassette domain-containing protein [Haloferax litoreum]
MNTRTTSSEFIHTEPATTVESAVVSVRDISHSYGTLTVLDSVSLTVSAGELVAVVGPNGSGKSTFLRLLTGAQRPTSGTIVYGRSGDKSTDSDATVGYLPQRLHPRDEFTVSETLDYYANLADDGLDHETVVELVGLHGVSDRRVGALSGGMRRLLGLGIAIVGDPDLVVLDEPTSGLDRTMTRRVFEVCRDVADAGPAVVLASHDLSTVERMADRVVFVDGGGIRFDGPPSTFGGDDCPLVDAYDDWVETGGNTTVRGATR